MKHKDVADLLDEFKSLKHTKDHFVFEDIPYGVPGNTGDINIVSSYTSDTVELLPGGGMRLKCELTDKSHKEFMAGWNGTTNTNYDTLPELWEWKAPKVTSRLNGRFQYGYVEVRLKAPKGYGPWPAAWLNGCYGFVAESTGEFLLQDDYPFLCGQFWPPELDFFEHFSPEHTWWWRPNSHVGPQPQPVRGTGKSRRPAPAAAPRRSRRADARRRFPQVRGPRAQLDAAGRDPDDARPDGRGVHASRERRGRVPRRPDRAHDHVRHAVGTRACRTMDGHFMVRFTKEQMVLYLSGQLRPILIPEMPCSSPSTSRSCARGWTSPTAARA